MNIGARKLPEVEYNAIKAATRKLVEMNGGQEPAADATRVSHQHVQRYASTSDPSFMPADIIADLERVCGAPVLTERLARLQGYVLQRIPQAGNSTDGNWVEMLTAFVREGSDVEIGLAEASADGEVDEDEAAALIGEIHEAQKVLSRMESALTAIVMRGGAE